MTNGTRTVLVLGALYAWSVAVTPVTGQPQGEAPAAVEQTEQIATLAAPEGTVEMTMEPAELVTPDITLQRDVVVPSHLIVGVMTEQWTPNVDGTSVASCTMRSATGLWLAADPGDVTFAHYAGLPVQTDAPDFDFAPRAGDCERGTMIVVPTTYLTTGDGLLFEDDLLAQVANARAFMNDTSAEWQQMRKGTAPQSAEAPIAPTLPAAQEPAVAPQ